MSDTLKSNSSWWMCFIFNIEDRFLDVERLPSQNIVRQMSLLYAVQRDHNNIKHKVKLVQWAIKTTRLNVVLAPAAIDTV